MINITENEKVGRSNKRHLHDENFY